MTTLERNEIVICIDKHVWIKNKSFLIFIIKNLSMAINSFYANEMTLIFQQAYCDM